MGFQTFFHPRARWFLPAALALAGVRPACGLESAELRAEVFQALPRPFALPLPLFSAQSAWNQKADTAAVLPESGRQMLLLYRVMRGDDSTLNFEWSADWPFMWVNHDEFTIPIFLAGESQGSVLLRDYEGNPGAATPKFLVSFDNTVTVPVPSGLVRPSGPAGLESDGHLAIFDSGAMREYDFWQATTVRDPAGNSLGGGMEGSALLEAGAVDYSELGGSGANPDGYFSARATGPPLLAGLILPEDVEHGAIRHALALAVPGLRNTSPDPSQPLPSDYCLPASTTETDFINADPESLAAGQRLRLKQTLVDDEGLPLDESLLAPITRMFLRALRDYGAYLVDNAGGFVFYAEDIHTASLNLSDEDLGALIGLPSETPLPPGKTKWQMAIERLLMDLEQIPIAFGPWQEGQDPSTAQMTVANFEVVESFRQAEGLRLHFAHFGNGEGFTSDVVLTNPSALETVTGRIEFFGDDGLPLVAGIAAAGGGSSARGAPAALMAGRVDFSLPPLGGAIISSDGQGGLAVGSAMVTSDGPLGGVLRFRIPGIGIAGVVAAPPAGGFIVPARRQAGGINTGIAVRSAASQAVSLSLTLRSLQGETVAGGLRTIESFPAGGHLAQFLQEIFPDADTADFVGTLTVEANGGMVSAVALELGTDPGQFTTLPVTPL